MAKFKGYVNPGGSHDVSRPAKSKIKVKYNKPGDKSNSPGCLGILLSIIFTLTLM